MQNINIHIYKLVAVFCTQQPRQSKQSDTNKRDATHLHQTTNFLFFAIPCTIDLPAADYFPAAGQNPFFLSFSLLHPATTEFYAVLSFVCAARRNVKTVALQTATTSPRAYLASSSNPSSDNPRPTADLDCLPVEDHLELTALRL